MLDEGAGDLDAKQFQERMEEIAMRMSFDDARDAFYGSFETLTENRDQAVALLALALSKPRFDADAVERMRGQLLAGLAYAARDPDRVASEQWAAMAFAGHPYGRPANGTPAIDPEDRRATTSRDFWSRTFAKDNAARRGGRRHRCRHAGRHARHACSAQLPAKAKLTPVAADAAGRRREAEGDRHGRAAVGGALRPARHAAQGQGLHARLRAQHRSLGGGVMSSRLWEEVREKRGLAYSVHTTVQPYKHTSVFSGGVATKNEEIAQSLDLIRAELKRIAADGPTEKELTDAKSYLTGSFALRFDSNAKIANQLLWFWQEDLGLDYVDKRNAEIEAVTLADAKRVAKRLFEGQELIVTIVGKPERPRRHPSAPGLRGATSLATRRRRLADHRAYARGAQRDVQLTLDQRIQRA